MASLFRQNRTTRVRDTGARELHQDLTPRHSYLSAFNKRHFALPGGWRSNIIYLWFGI